MLRQGSLLYAFSQMLNIIISAMPQCITHMTVNQILAGRYGVVPCVFVPRHSLPFTFSVLTYSQMSVFYLSFRNVYYLL